MSGIDSAFIDYIKSIPYKHYDLVKMVAYAGIEDEFRDFECESPAKGPRKKSYSRFIVPVAVIKNPEVMRRMKYGPWPIGSPREFFSEEWWVEHAIWQMVARESRQFLDNLALRIDEFNICGPP